ncbi:MAG: PEGA domain-containing protein [Myxococcales bacterium]|nr:PEGA domain-containing protein [Myxococcales bacterium]
MRPPVVPAVVLSLCLTVGGAPVVRAAESAIPTSDASRLAVLPLKVDGQVDEVTRKRWSAALREGLSRGTSEVVDDGQVTPYIDGSCSSQACYDKIRANSSATHIVRATVVQKNRDYLLKIDLIDARSGVVATSSEETCEICGNEEVGKLLDSQGALLQTRLAAQGKGPAVLFLDTNPSGAIVYIDGEAVGTTPLERPVLEGAHKVRVSLNGYVAEERELSFVNGVREELTLPLQRAPGNPKTLALGAAGLAGGILLIGSGVAMVALDDVPYRKGDKCSGVNVDADGDCKFVYNTGPLGAVLIGVGAVLGTLGAVALHRNRGAKLGKKGKERAQVVPSGLGVMGRF